MMSVPVLTKRRKAWLGAAALAALVAGGALESGVLAPSLPARAEMLSLDKPVQAAPSFGDVVERVKPAVVSVRVKTQSVADRSDNSPFGTPRFDDAGLREFFRRFGEDNFRGFGERFRRGDRGGEERGQSRPGPRRFGQAQGSGFFVSADGYVVTNNHVVDKANSVEVVTDDGR